MKLKTSKSPALSFVCFICVVLFTLLACKPQSSADHNRSDLDETKKNETPCTISGNGQGCGGGGDVLAKAKAKLDSILLHYESNGATPGFGRDYGKLCKSKHSPIQCDKLQKSGSEIGEQRMALAQRFISERSSLMRQKLNSLPISVVRYPLFAPGKNGEKRDVWARVTQELGVEVSENFLLSAKHIEDVVALLAHELCHAVPSLSGGSAYGDFDVGTGYEVSSDFLEFIGGSVSTDFALDSNPYRDEVLKEREHLVTYIPFEDAVGSTHAVNWVRNQPNGKLTGLVTPEASGVIAGTNAFRFDRHGLDGGDVRLRNVDLHRSKTVTVEFWMNMDSGVANRGSSTDALYNLQVMPFGFNSFDLWVYERGFGFNTTRGDLKGVESSWFGGRWSHVAAVFSDHLESPLKLYVDGFSRTLNQRRNPEGPNPALALVDGDLVVIGGWGPTGGGTQFLGSIDEVAIYDYELPASTVLTHYRTVNPGMTQSGSATVTLVPGSRYSGNVAVTLQNHCVGGRVFTSARTVDVRNNANGRSFIRSLGFFSNSNFYLRVDTEEGAAFPANADPIIVDYSVDCLNN